MNWRACGRRFGSFGWRLTLIAISMILTCCAPAWKIIATSKDPGGPSVVCEEQPGYDTDFRATIVVGQRARILQPPVRGFAQRLAVMRSPDGRDAAVLACLRQGEGPVFKGFSGSRDQMMTAAELASFARERFVAAGYPIDGKPAFNLTRLAIEACDSPLPIPGEVPRLADRGR